MNLDPSLLQVNLAWGVIDERYCVDRWMKLRTLVIIDDDSCALYLVMRSVAEVMLDNSLMLEDCRLVLSILMTPNDLCPVSIDVVSLNDATDTILQLKRKET